MRDPREEYFDLVSAKIRRDREAKAAKRPMPISAPRLASPAAPPPPDPALVAFERVRSAALARHAAEERAAAQARAAREPARREEDRAIEMILKSHAAMLGQSPSH